MQTLILNILASDITSSSYCDSDNCAITKALARAGRPDLVDAGVEISLKDNSNVVFIGNRNTSYAELTNKIVAMYQRILEPEDFTHTLTY